MGIKGWVTLGGGLLLALLAALGLRKEDLERNEKIQKMISDVDRKEPEKNEEVKSITVEELISEVNDAVSGMGIGNSGKEDPKARTFEQIEADYQQMRETKQRILDGIKSNSTESVSQEMKEEEWQKQQEEKAEKRWQDAVAKGIKDKNFHKLENLFDQKYAGGPWHPSPASVFGDAHHDGVITIELYKEAQDYFGKLWCYSGD